MTCSPIILLEEHLLPLLPPPVPAPMLYVPTKITNNDGSDLVHGRVHHGTSQPHASQHAFASGHLSQVNADFEFHEYVPVGLQSDAGNTTQLRGDARKSQLMSEMYFKDDACRMNVMVPAADNAGNLSNASLQVRCTHVRHN